MPALHGFNQPVSGEFGLASYIERLHQAQIDRKTPALVGIDPRFDMLPQSVVEAARSRGLDEFGTRAAAFEDFGKRLIDVVAPLVPAVKPQAAFFEELGPDGVVALRNVISHARKQGLIVICDAKRGDIGSTATAYAHAYLAGEDPDAAPFAADALTINAYLGIDTLDPFVDLARERGAGLYVLVRTSNPGAAAFQDLEAAGRPVFEYVADAVEQLAAGGAIDRGYGVVGAVVGATYPKELTSLRQKMPSVPLLVPGYGSQGGGAQDVAGGFDSGGLGALINSSRAINFAYRKGPFAEQFSPDRWEEAILAATRSMIEDLAGVCPIAD